MGKRESRMLALAADRETFETMQRLLSCLLAAFAIFVSGLSALADPASDLNAALDRTFEIVNSGDDAGATDFHAKALGAAEAAKPRDARLTGLMAEGYFYLGRFRFNADKYAEAEETLRKSIGLVESSEETRNDKLKASALEVMGKAVGRQQRPGNAVAIFNLALQVEARAYGRASAERVLTMQYMAITFEAAGLDKAAEFYWRTALGIATGLGQPAEDLAALRKDLATNLDRQGRKDEAARIAAGEAVIDPEGVLLATIEKAGKLSDAGREKEAMALYLKARDEFRVTASRSPLYLIVLGATAVADGNLFANHAAHAAVYEEADRIEADILGVAQKQAGEYLFKAALSRALDGDFDAARKHLDTLKSWGALPKPFTDRQRGLGAIIKAGLGERAECTPPVAAEDAKEMLYAGYALSTTLESYGRHSARAAPIRCSLSLAGGQVEPQLTFNTQVALGIALIDSGQYDEAKSVFTEALAWGEAQPTPPGEMNLLRIFAALAEGWTRDFDKATVLLATARAGIAEGDIGARLQLYRSESLIAFLQGHHEATEAPLREALALLDAMPPGADVDEERAETLDNLATAIVQSGRYRDALAIYNRISFPEQALDSIESRRLAFYIGLVSARFELRLALDDDKAATEEADRLIHMLTVASERALAQPDRHRIYAAILAAQLVSTGERLSAIGRGAEGERLAAYAERLSGGDASRGVQLVLTRADAIRGMAALERRDVKAANAAFDKALKAALDYMPPDSADMMGIWYQHGVARQMAGEPVVALGDFRKAAAIAEERTRLHGEAAGLDLKAMTRPAFTGLVGAAWATGRE
jgi:tetratricopeptide (TPR) repeat protein